MHELAKEANEEVKLQSKMLDTLEAKIDDVHEHVTNVNARLKTTLEEARKSDKICMVSDGGEGGACHLSAGVCITLPLI